MGKITQQDLKVMQAERMSDEPDSGGLPSNKPVGNNLNSLFPPISDVDNTVGRVNMRKVFAGVFRDDAEPLYGAHNVITDPPDHENISVVAFKATKYGDTRIEARRRLEAYSIATIESKMVLLSDQQTGSRIVQGYQEVSEPLPNDGEVYCLRQDKTGYPYIEQYFRIADVDDEIRTFIIGGAEFQKRVLKLEITAPLLHDFEGMEYPIKDTIATCPVKILETQVADSAVYHGVKPLAEDAAQNDGKINIGGLFGRVVPTSLKEKAAIDLRPSTVRKMWVRSGQERAVSNSGNGSGNIYFNHSVLPGSIKYRDFNDNGDGTITNPAGAILQVNYVQGVIYDAPTIEVVNAIPATETSGFSHTSIIPITIANQGTEWAPLFDPIPAEGSLVVDYMVLGKWYRLYDNGTGKLISSENRGSGQINFSTGSAIISLGELPDDDTNIIFSWCSTKLFQNLDGSPITTGSSTNLLSFPAKLTFSMPNTFTSAILPLDIQWKDAADTNRTATISSNDEKISGDATGHYDRNANKVVFETEHSPNADGITFDYSYIDGTTEMTSLYGTITDNGGATASASFPSQVTLSDGTQITLPVLTDSVFKHQFIQIEGITEIDFAAHNNGSFYGNFRFDGNGAIGSHITDAYHGIGILESDGISASARTITIDKSKLLQKKAEITYKNSVINSASTSHEHVDTVGIVKSPLKTVTAVIVSFYNKKLNPPSSPVIVQKSLNLKYTDATLKTNSLLKDLIKTARLLPGSLKMEYQGDYIYDREGELFKNINPLTGAGELIGFINYTTAKVDFLNTSTADGVTTLAILEGVVVLDDWSVKQFHSRTHAAPLKPGSLSIRGLTVNDGSQLIGTSQANSSITGGLIGEVDHETGYYFVEVPQSTTVGDPPVRLAPESIFLNAVTYSYLPLETEIIGVDATRLPADGRVPIFRRGDMIILTNAKRYIMPFALTAGQVINLPRQNLDKICLLDKKGEHVLIDHYSVDLQAGKITMVDKVDLTNFEMPMTAVARKSIPTPAASQVVNTGITDAMITVIDANAAPVDTALYSVDTASGDITFASPLDLTPYSGPYKIEVRQPIGSNPVGGQAINLKGSSYDTVRVIDNTGANITSTLYASDLTAGSVTFVASLDLSAYTLPLTAVHAYETRNRITDAKINGELTLQFPLDKSYPAAGTYVSSALLGGDLIVTASALFAQKTWKNAWKNEIEGDPILAQYNDQIYPIVLTDNGSIEERWALRFTSATGYELFGETVGLVAQGDTITDLIPVNPATNVPYFTMKHEGFGGGWAAGNVIRFNTFASNTPVWLIRATMPSAVDIVDVDGFTLCTRGNTIKE